MENHIKVSDIDIFQFIEKKKKKNSLPIYFECAVLRTGLIFYSLSAVLK